MLEILGLEATTEAVYRALLESPAWGWTKSLSIWC